MQAAQAKVSAHMIHVEQTAQKIIVDKTAAVVQEAQVHCANVQSQASAAVSQAQEAAHAAASFKEAAVQEGINKTMQTADETYEITKAAIILEAQRTAHAQCEAEKKKLREEYEQTLSEQGSTAAGSIIFEARKKKTRIR